MDDKDFVFENKFLTIKQDKDFSEFLKLRKLKSKKKKAIKTVNEHSANISS